MLPLPSWVNSEDGTEDERRRVKSTFLVRLAALYASPVGTVQDLTRKLGYSSPAALASIITKNGEVTPEQAVGIENIVGRHIVTREALRPDLFDFPREEAAD